MFVDIAKIKIKAGRGGDGVVSFHREKYIAAGGPDGGDGGVGGSVIFVVDEHMSTLLDFRFKRKYEAASGEPGDKKRCSGRAGADLVIRVPRGTLIKDAESGALMHDMSDDMPYIVARGGRGGWGNARFSTPTRQAPRFAKPGQEGEERTILLELKLIADVGLIGFPNVGKSTLLSVISKAQPKIANYHFTTLSPNLGVVYVGEGASFVAADIPGLIEGAAQGAGLGHDFLRHIDRCRLLVHVVDVSGSEYRDPVADLDAINEELGGYSEALSQRPQIIAANKSDILELDSENMKRLRARAEELGYPVYEISAATRAGVDALIHAVWHALEQLPPVAIFEDEYVPVEPAVTERDIHIEVRDGVYYVTGAWCEKVLSSVNFDDYESRMYFERILRRAGVFDMLEKAGIEEKDTVDFCGWEFEYVY